MKLALSSLQWAMFILSGSIVTPLAVGVAFDLDPVQLGQLLQRSLFAIGLCCLLQGWIGHRLPILEGPAGLWWGVFLTFSTLAVTPGEKWVTLQSMELGLIVSGSIFILFSLLGWVEKLKSIFTPAVTGTYLVLLVLQLSGPLIKGVLGIQYLSSTIDLPVALGALATLVFTVWLSRSRNPYGISYSILIGLLAGWMLFAVTGMVKPVPPTNGEWVALPDLFAWGTPHLDAGILLTSALTSLLLLTNLVASVDVVETALQAPKAKRYDRGGLVMGINHMISALFSTIGCVPNSTSAGFIVTTKIKELAPFLVGSALIVGLSLFPSVSALMSTIPTPVAYATVLIPFGNLLYISLRDYIRPLHDRSLAYTGISVMAGVGVLFIPVSSLSEIPSFLAPIVTNGMVVGVLMCLALEQSARWLEGRRVRFTENSSSDSPTPRETTKSC